jgi:Tfp pilus assembly protein PilN
VSQQINLFNPVFLKQKKMFSALAMLQLLSIVALALVAISVISNYRLSKLQAEAKLLANTLKSTQAQLASVVERTKPHPVDKALEEDVRKAEVKLRANRQLLAFANAGQLTGSHGYADYFRALSRRTMAGVWLSQIMFDDDGKNIEIKGRAVQASMVPEYVALLSREDVFKGRSLGSIRILAPGAPGSGGGESPIPRPMAKAPPQQPALEQTYVDFRLASMDELVIVDPNAEGKAK